MKYSSDTLNFWTSPLSTSEEQRVENTISMIKNAIASYGKLSDSTIETFAQGSYANNTNVRQNSDVDICVMLRSTCFCKYVEGKTDNDYGFTSGTTTYQEFRALVINALVAKFGATTVSPGNKCIEVRANNYHIDADIVPAFQYRNYSIISSLDPTEYVEGTKFIAVDGKAIVNYPQDHIRNGKQKNISTNYAYKKLVRIMKHIRDDMVYDGLADEDKITSFLIECLVWNVPDIRITTGLTWAEIVQDAISYLWNAIKDEKHKKWTEVSKRLYLFHSDRKWTDIETKDFLFDMYGYLDFK